MDWFDRVPMRYRPALEAARAVLPPPVEQAVPKRFLCGVNPLFVGLHATEDTTDGRSYANTAHACYPWHTADGIPRIVFPEREDEAPPRTLYTFIHEIGHIYDFVTDFQITPPGTTAYSATNRQEAFAEAFTLLLHPEYTPGWGEYLSQESFKPFRDFLGLT